MHGAATCILLLGICILCLTDQSDAVCKDRKRNCKELAEMGLCTQNKKANKIIKKCRASCNLCSADTGKAAETTGGAGCTDKKRSCKKMAAKGFCTDKKHAKKMKKRCKASCHLCSGTSGTAGTDTPQVPECKDEKPKCKKLAKKGFCTDKKQKKKMRKRCKASCNLCSGNSGTAGTDTPQVPECKDEKPKCKKLAKKGFCTDKKQKKKMRKRCKASCNLCIQNMPGRPSNSGPEEP
ncbi:zinc metalloproteinase nas-13-like isoform X2 [Haliotis rufescens]|uniref:zinc metalloproteinase nas-13-like isoform X2 n=1 Tax=Haliotis rufescens TaxID=6454 RepID=UPI00201E7A33|nr:zinc metalloproteinase nas-13-like isoform X2 [Haliotis rufescens]